MSSYLLHFLTTLAQSVVFKYGRDPSSIFKEAVDGLFQQFLEALNLEWCSMPSHDKVYTLDSCWLVYNLLTSNIRRILHASWRMQLTSCSNIPWELWTIWMTYHALLQHNILTWQLETGKQVVEFKYGKDPSSIFKDAVDRLFQQSLSTLNLGNDKTCILMIRYTYLIIAVWHTKCWAKIIKGSFKYLQGCSWRAAPACPSYSKSFECLPLRWRCLIVSCYTQLTTATLHNKLLNKKNEDSFKWL